MRPFNRKDLHSIKIALESDNDFYNSSIRLDITRINLFCLNNILVHGLLEILFSFLRPLWNFIGQGKLQ